MAEKKSPLWLGILPYIGVILFLIDCAFIFSSHATGALLHQQLLADGVTDMIGWAGLGAGIAHLFFWKQISASIGFEHNAFEFEVGMCDLAFGIVGLMATWYPPAFWLAIIWFTAIYRVGCGIGHVLEIIVSKNYAINNTAILFLDFIVPLLLLGAYYAWVR
jgi:hypothetical protein